jgi:hypothetical protein
MPFIFYSSRLCCLGRVLDCKGCCLLSVYQHAISLVPHPRSAADLSALGTFIFPSHRIPTLPDASLRTILDGLPSFAPSIGHQLFRSLDSTTRP